MGEFSPLHWVVVALVILVLFGGKQIPEVMRGLGQGIREFKEGMHRARVAAPTTPPAPQQRRRQPLQIRPPRNRR